MERSIVGNLESSGTAVVTGASTGIGAGYARRLARRGFDVVLVARRQDKLDALAQEIGAETGRTPRVLVADLSDRGDLERVAETLRNDASLALLVNNAGTATLAPFAPTDPALNDAMLDLNITALTRLTSAALPGLIARNRGAIINIGSVVGLFHTPYNAVYGGTKAYVLHFSRAIADEVAGTGVQIQAVLPGAVRTDIWNTAPEILASIPEEGVMSADDLVDAALAGFDSGELVTIPSLPDLGQWQAYDEARNALVPNLSRKQPADRYLQAVS